VSADKITTTVKLPGPTEIAMLKNVVSEGYGLRGKSKWIEEAVESFLVLPNYHELVDIADEMKQLTRMVSIRLSQALAQRIDEAVVTVRRYYPELEGVRSKILRASIIQRLLRR